MSTQALARIDDFVRRTREALFVRRADDVLMVRPDKTMRANRTAVAILGALYDRPQRPAGDALRTLAPALGVGFDRLLADTEQLVAAVGAILNEEFAPRPGLAFAPLDRSAVAFPTLAEIALTYGCQNRCAFCYADSPHRSPAGEAPGAVGRGSVPKTPMGTAEVKRVMDRVFHEAHVPSLSFTGGEATLRPDLPDLVRHGADLGLRINLITNGLRLADAAYARTLVDAGLASAQVSIEAADAALHDRIVGRAGAHARTVAGVRNLRALGIHVHTNTTLCGLNLAVADDIVRFVARDLSLRTLSMNMVIRTGQAEAHDASSPARPAHERVGVTYTEVGARLPALLAVAVEESVRLVWYSPIPYCIFNPVLHGVGAKSCACVDGILSVDPTGEVLPCSSFERGLGSLLERPFARIYESRKARYWRRKRFVPPICERCPDVDVCGGACPLYWDAAGSFAEIPRPGADDPRARRRWERARARSGCFGVAPRGAAAGGASAGGASDEEAIHE